MLLGVYKGNGSDGRKGVPSFTTFMGRDVDFVSDFIDFSSRSGFDGDAGWTAGGWAGFGKPICLGVPTLCNGEKFSDIISGSLDQHYINLCAAFFTNNVNVKWVRLGWEDNAQTTPGYASQDWSAHFVNYKAARAHLYQLIKKQPGFTNTMILQDFSYGWQQVQITGDSNGTVWDPVVLDANGNYKSGSADGLGLTVYPQTWSTATTEPSFTQNLLYNEGWQLNGFSTWPCMSDGKPAPKLITEYGACGTRSDGHGAPNAGDDPTWTNGSLNMLKSWGDKCIGVATWDYHAGDFNGQFSDGGFPNSGKAFKAFFANTTTTVTPTPTPTPTPAPTPVANTSSYAANLASIMASHMSSAPVVTIAGCQVYSVQTGSGHWLYMLDSTTAANVSVTPGMVSVANVYDPSVGTQPIQALTPQKLNTVMMKANTPLVLALNI